VLDVDVTGTWDTSPTAPISPKDRFVTIYGRNPVLEALSDQHLAVDKVLLADTARGPHVGEIRAAARARGVPIQVVDAERVKKIAGNGNSMPPQRLGWTILKKPASCISAMVSAGTLRLRTQSRARALSVGIIARARAINSSLVGNELECSVCRGAVAISRIPLACFESAL
jgi:hypothetical protein